MHIYNDGSNIVVLAYILNKRNNIIVKNERIMLATKVDGKIYQPKTYEEPINDLIHSRCQKKIIKKKI